MAWMTAEQRGFGRDVSRLVYANPFLPERIDAERAALGPDFVATGTLWDTRAAADESPNVVRLNARVEAVLQALRSRTPRPLPAAGEERAVYEDLVIYHLFNRYQADFHALIEGRGPAGRIGFYEAFARDLEDHLGPAGAGDPAHLFACLFQVRRAFHYIFRNIRGGSRPAGRLRAAVWQSIFTRDMRRYRRSLYRHMGDVATLVSGPSGTGKELVARAIGLARYVPFDPAGRRFAEDFAASFYALNLSALSPTLIESELFGHRRGAFTGALQDRAGWLEVCPPLGTVFLDEVGEVDLAIQVKLLRVLQARTFQRLGDTQDRSFQGKIVAATNRALGDAIAAGRFRADLYYRLCSDLIATPSLQEQLADAPAELHTLVLHIAERIAGEAEAAPIAAEAEAWIARRLGADYPWPGNVRELEQCVRNVMVRGEYHPPMAAAAPGAPGLADAFLAGTLTAEAMLRRYCTVVYARTGSYLEAARRLGLDRRTVKEKIDPALLAELGLPPPGSGRA
jgi:hypothetical protein